MPPKKKTRALVYLPQSLRFLLNPAGDVREYYLPLTKEEIEEDLERLGSLLAQSGKRRGAGRLVGAGAGGAHLPASSEDASPSSQQGEDENESANPSEQHAAGGQQAAQHWMGGKGAAGAAEQQPMVAA